MIHVFLFSSMVFLVASNMFIVPFVVPVPRQKTRTVKSPWRSCLDVEKQSKRLASSGRSSHQDHPTCSARNPLCSPTKKASTSDQGRARAPAVILNKIAMKIASLTENLSENIPSIQGRGTLPAWYRSSHASRFRQWRGRRGSMRRVPMRQL
jgi:hypothetical protein